MCSRPLLVREENAENPNQYLIRLIVEEEGRKEKGKKNIRRKSTGVESRREMTSQHSREVCS
jgi:hypothetical protein